MTTEYIPIYETHYSSVVLEAWRKRNNWNVPMLTATDDEIVAGGHATYAMLCRLRAAGYCVLRVDELDRQRRDDESVKCD